MPTPAGPSPQPVAIIKRPARFSPPAVVWLCGLLYFATASGRLGTWDADLYYTVTQRIATERRLDIPREMTLSHTEAWRGPDGLYYSPFDLGQSIANLPFYALGRLAAARLPESARDFAARGAVAASNALWTALTVWVVFLAAGLLAPGGPAESSRESTAKDGAAAWRFQTGAALLYGLGTLAWPYSAMGFNQPLAALGQTIGLWGTMRLLQRPNANDALLVGAGCAMAIFTRLNTILAVPWYMAAIALILWCAQHSPPDKNGDNGGVSATKIAKIKLAFGLPIAAALLANACYNYLRFGSFFHTGYRGDPNTAFSLLAIPKGLAILVFSPAKGAIYYMPLLALSLIGWLHWFRGADRMEGAAAPDTAIQLLAWRRRMAATMGGGIALFYLLFFSAMHYGHSGVHSWGPRFLVPLAPWAGLFAWAGYEALRPRRAARLAGFFLIAASIALQAAATVSDQSERVHALTEKLGDSWNPEEFFSLRGNMILDRFAALGEKAAGAIDPSRPHAIASPPPKPPGGKAEILAWRRLPNYWWAYAGAMGVLPRWALGILGLCFAAALGASASATLKALAKGEG